jgi:hypothetical protein
MRIDFERHRNRRILSLEKVSEMIRIDEKRISMDP